MRVNVYDEEFSSDIELVSSVPNADGDEYFGIRFYLADPSKEAHEQRPKDERAAVTMWCKQGKYNETTTNQDRLARTLYAAAKLIERRERQQK